MNKNGNIHISIEGIMYDLDAGVLTLKQALEELQTYFVEGDTTSNMKMITKSE